MPPNDLTWPSEQDLRTAGHPEFVLLSRVLVGLRRLSSSDHRSGSSQPAISRETHELVAVLLATQARIRMLTTQLTDGTATTDSQRRLADQLEELVTLLHHPR